MFRAMTTGVIHRLFVEQSPRLVCAKMASMNAIQAFPYEHESNLSDCLQNYYLLLFNQVLFAAAEFQCIQKHESWAYHEINSYWHLFTEAVHIHESLCRIIGRFTMTNPLYLHLLLMSMQVAKNVNYNPRGSRRGRQVFAGFWH